ncbi:hypothetical protein V8B97DRAFT_1985576 [Scleroderma yunnanense]
MTLAAPPPTDKGPTLPVPSTSPFSHSQNIHIHQAVAGSSTTKEVVTAPPWAHDEPPSPTDSPLDNNHCSPAGILNHHRPSTSFSHGGPSTENRSRWWAFARPRDGVTNQSRHALTWAAMAAPQRDSGFGWKEKDSMEDTPVSPSPMVPKPSQPTYQAVPDWNSTWGSSNVYQQGHRGDYAQLGRGSSSPYDDESGAERSTLEHPRRGCRGFILSNIYVPLLFRFINITFTTATLAVAIHIRKTEIQYGVMGILGSSPTLVIIFAPLTLVHVMVAIYLEYFGRPLGLWRTSGKLAHTLLEVCFICAWSAALSLCFDNFFTSPIPCASPANTAWYNQLPKPTPPLAVSAVERSVGNTLCDSQLALICLVGVGLVMYCINLVISLFRIFEKVKHYAGIRRRTR